MTFFADGVEIAADPDSPYQAVYTVPASHIVGTQIRFTARAADFAGNTAESDPLLVRVVAPGSGDFTGSRLPKAPWCFASTHYEQITNLIMETMLDEMERKEYDKISPRYR